MRAESRRRTAGRYILLGLLAFIVLFPIYITVVNSLLTPARFGQSPPAFFPSNPQWHNYADAWTDGHLSRYVANSFIVAASITAAQVVTAVMGAYAFAFLRFPFKGLLFVLFLATLMIPGEVTFFTNVDTVRSFGWYDTYAALIVPFVASG